MLTRLTEPTVDPVPLAEMKAHLAVEDTLRDELISAYTAAAVSYVEQHCNLALAQAEYAVRLDAETRLPLVIPVWPVASVDAIAFEGESPETAVFVIRWLAGIDATMRVVHDGKVYDIQGLAEIGTRDGLEITATAQGV